MDSRDTSRCSAWCWPPPWQSAWGRASGGSVVCPQTAQFGFADSESYWALGRQIARGEPYQFGEEDARVFRTPGYPLLLASLFWVGGDQPPVMWARALGAVLGTLAVGGVCWLTRLLHDGPTSLLAASMAAVYPGAISMSVFVLSESLFCPLMLLQFVLWIVAWRSPRGNSVWWLATLSGCAAGAATLVRPAWLLFTPLAILVFALGYPERGRQLRIAGFLLAGFVLTMSPWWIRNFAVTGRFVPTTLQVGASLYDGLNPRATGASNMWWDERTFPLPEVHDEIGRDRQLRQAALSWAEQNPGRVLRLAGIKLLRMWNFWPNEPSLGSWPLRLALMFTYGPVIALAAGGAGLFTRRGWPHALCWLPAAYLTALHVVFVSSIRYREPAMLALIVLAAGAAAVAWRKLKQSEPNDQRPMTNDQ